MEGIEMKHHAHIINTIMARSGLIQMALEIGDKKQADKIHAECIDWFMKTYKVERTNKS